MNVDVDVIIIGAGAAGIAAAVELQKSSVSYLILEARNRIGGRAYTDHETFTSTSVDLGGSWIHLYRPENPIYQYYQEYLVDKQIAHVKENDVYRCFNEHGQQISNESMKQAEEICQQIFTSLEQFTSMNGNDCSIEEFIRENHPQSADLSNEVRSVLGYFLHDVELYEASNLISLSAKQWEAYYEDLSNDIFVPFGYGSIIEHLVDKYKLLVNLNTVVTSIDSTDPNRIAIKIENDDTVKYCRQVIVTIPLGCLKRNTIKFEPSLPDWKCEAIDRMGFGLLNKLVLQFSECFWDSTMTSLCYVNSQQQHDRFLYTKCLPPPANILIMLVHDTFARQLENQTDEQILNEVMNFLRTIFPQSQIPSPIRYKFTRWSQDPFAYGSYSNYPVNTSPQTVGLLAKETAEGRIQWAGEHTNDTEWNIGYIHSAIGSGQKAARTLIEHRNQ